MDKAKLGIALYTVLGAALAAAGGAMGYMYATGSRGLGSPADYLVAAGAIAALAIGLHWLIVGLASLRD